MLLVTVKSNLKKLKGSNFTPSGLSGKSGLSQAISNRGGTRANYTIDDWIEIAKDVGVNDINDAFNSSNSNDWEDDLETNSINLSTSI